MLHKKHNRLVELDALRGFAALSVVLFHYFSKYNHPIDLPNWFNKGGLGVSLFFMISGFVIYMSLNHSSTIKSFIISRFARLYPAYWTAIFITSLFIFIFRDTFNLEQFLANLTMFQYWLRYSNIDGVYWTLRVEMSYYILMIIIFYFKSFFKIQHAIIAWLFLQIIINGILIKFLNFDYLIIKVISTLFILDFVHLFIAGMMLYYLYEKQQVTLSYTLICFSLVNSYIVDDTYHFISFFFFIVLFISIFKFNIRILRINFFRFLGTISYSLYLLHQVIGYIVMDYLYQYNLNSYIVILLTFIFLIFLSFLNWKIVELILSKKLRIFLTKRFINE